MERAIRGFVITIGLAIAGSGCGAGGAQEAPVNEPVSVRAAEITHVRMSPPIVASGILGPREEIGLAFKIGGVIQRITVDAGTEVSAGQVLASLDLREIDATVARAQSAAQKAERDLARARRLYADSVVTLAQLQDAETAAEVARADLESARFNRKYAVIAAPSSGVILHRNAEPGEMTSPGEVVLVLGSQSRGSVIRVGLTDRDVLRVRKGDNAEVRFSALPDDSFEGRVTEVAAASEAATGTWVVEVLLLGAAPKASGLVAEVTIKPAGGVLAALVPVEAMLEADGSEATVFALSADGQRAERRRVRVAWLTGDQVALLSGLEGATAVVTDGAAWLRDGEPVRVVQ